MGHGVRTKTLVSTPKREGQNVGVVVEVAKTELVCSGNWAKLDGC